MSGRGSATRWLAALALAGLAAACSSGPPEPEPPDDEQLLELYTTSATYFYEDDDLLQAQGQAVKALEIDPENRAMRRLIGWVRLRLGTSADLIIAERFFRDLTREGDENGATVLGLATSMERLGVGYDESARALRSGEREPPKGKTAEERARELDAKAHACWEESLALYESLLEGGEGSTRSMNGLQRVHALLGDYEESLHWSQVLLERSQEELETWRRMLTAADLTESEEKLFRTNEQAALDLRRNTHLFAATLLHRLGRDRDAVEHLDDVVRSEPDLAQAYSQRAQLWMGLGEYERAKADLDRYIGLTEEPLDSESLERAFRMVAECETKLRG